MKWQKLATAVFAPAVVRLLLRIGLPALGGALLAVLAELPPEVANAIARQLCGS